MTTETKATSEIVTRIKKLLAMARSGTENEAATAAAMATRLMERYSIDEAMLESDAAVGESFVRREVVRLKTKMPAWLMTLAGGVLFSSGCHAAVASGVGYGLIIGTGPADVLDRAEIMIGWLRQEVDRFAEALPTGVGRSFHTSFRNGCASRIVARIEAARQAEREEIRREARAPREDKPAGYALARVESAIERLDERAARAEAFLRAQLEAEGQKLGPGRRRRRSTNAAGWAAGQQAGNRASITAPAGRLPG